MKVIAMNNVPVKLWVDQLDAHAWEEVNNTAFPFSSPCTDARCTWG